MIVLKNQQSYKSGFVSLIGRTNVGKSTLLNAAIGQKVVIMSDKPQTTRHKIHSVLTRDDAQIVFLDTPGVHKPKHKLGGHLVNVALSALREVDVVLFVVESSLPGAGDEYLLNHLKQVKCPVFLIINKIDLVTKDELILVIDTFEKKYNFTEIIPISALTGDNVNTLIEQIVKYLPEGLKYYPDNMVVDKPESFIMAELIREKILHLTSQEIPHSVAVTVDNIEKRSDDLVAVSATIYTERDSQKAIIIGKGGSMLKQVGKNAREEIERLLGSRIFLDLWVKVKANWKNKENILRNFGYVDEE